MRPILLSLLLVGLTLSATAKQRSWQDAQVLKIEQSEVEIEEDLYRSSAPSGSVGQPLPTGAEKRRKKIYTYEFKTDQHRYVAKVEKKPLEGVQEGGKIQVAAQKDELFVLMPYGKERKLELVKTD